MGTKYILKCSSCDYTVLTTAGTDYGMLTVVDTYSCMSCRSIVDVCVGENGQTFTKEEISLHKDKSAIDIEFFVCPDCGSGEHLVKWSNRKRPCPKCGEKMEKDLQSEILMWD